MVNFTVEDNCYVNDKFIGTTVAKKITVNILNPNNEIDLEDKEIQVYTGMIKDGEKEEIPFGKFMIEKPKNEEVKEKTSFVGYDYMIKFNIPYKDRVTYPCKAKVLFQDICNQAGLVAGNLDFVNCDYMILGNPFTDNEDCRTVLSNIAQLAGGFAKIGRDDKPCIVTLDKTTLTETIDGNNYFTDFSKNNQWGELNSLILRISGIEGENTTLQDDSSVTENGLTELVIEDNYFLINQAEREKVINPLWNKLKGIKYLPFQMDYYGYPHLDSGDKIKILDSNDDEYETYIFNHTFTFNGGYSGKIETQALTKTQTAFKNTDNTKIKFRRVERTIDKINGKIEDIIEEQSSKSNKISKMEMDINSIRQEISNSTDVTTTVKGQGVLEGNGINESQPISIKIRPVGADITPLYPRDDLFPSNSLFPHNRELIFKQVNVLEGNEADYIEYNLPADLYYLDSNTYDEFYMNYENQECSVIKRVGIDEEGNKYALANPTTTTYDYPFIPLGGGDYEISMPAFPTAYMEIRLMLKNTYTSQFATQVQLNSAMIQTENSITQTVNAEITKANGKIDNISGELSLKLDTNNLVSSINAKANEITITSDYFKLTADGHITATGGTIAGLTMSTNSSGNSYLYKNYSSGGNTYQSGLYIPKIGNGSTVFLYAGVDVSSGSNTLGKANFYITHGGSANITSNGSLNFWYSNGKMQAEYGSDYINKYNDNGQRWISEGRGLVNGTATAHVMWIYNAQYYQIQDAIHSKTIVNFRRINDSATSNLDIQSYADIHVWGNRQVDGINNSMYIQGYEVATSASDERLKENIKICNESGLDFINKIQVLSFDWKKDCKTKDAGNHIRFGFGAQRTRDYESSLVNYNEEFDTYQMNNLNLIAPLYKAMQELSKKVEELENGKTN